MTAMINYISHLLHFHDCVIIPELGGFVANRQGAYINENQHLFAPPHKEIGFNRTLSHNDGLLASHVAQCEGITYSEALTLIADFVEKFRADIFAGRQIEMGDIGSFRGDAIGNILFTPKEVNSFLPEAFGLSSFRFEPVGYSHVIRLEKGRRASAVVGRRAAHYWMTAAIITGFLFLVSYDLNTPTVSQANLGNLFKWKQEVVTPSVQPQKEIAPIEVAQVNVAQNESAVSAEKRYHLIAASLNDGKKAEVIKNKFVQEGFVESTVLFDGKDKHRVALNSFDELDNAVKQMNELRKQKRFASVWVFKKK